MKGVHTTRFSLVAGCYCSIATVVFLAFPAYGQPHSPKVQQAKFTNNDIFRTAVFLENKGIVEPYKDQQVLYYTGHDHIHAFFTEKGVIYKLKDIDKKRYAEMKKEEREEGHKKQKTGATGEEEDGKPMVTSIVQMEWVGANPHPRIEVKEKGEGYYTYIKQADTGYVNLTTEGYKKIIYHDIYPGIDVEYFFPEKGGIEYALIVHPGADAGIIKLAYNGAIKKITRNGVGDITIHTPGGDLMEHAPVSYSSKQAGVASGFVLNNNYLQFKFPAGYNRDDTLIIDPWITALTTLPSENIGMKVDYDDLGNLFVYGAGPTSTADVAIFLQVAKYNNGGTLLWSFGGTVPSAPGGGWSTAQSGSGTQYNYAGGFRVDKVSGKSYISQGYDGEGTQTVRLTANGAYDGFISTQLANFREAWGIMYNCSDETIIDVGGGTNSNLTMGIINITTGVVVTSNITGIAGNQQDIICAVYDSAGNMYAIMNDADGILPYTNTIYRINTAYTGNLWDANSTYTVFQESNNQPYWCLDGGNWSNCLAANGNYLFYYDGKRLAAYSFTNGAMVGTPYTIAGYTALMQGGIAVDNCNNVYIGGIGVVKTFSFNGTAFTPGADISLGGAYASDALYDVAWNNTNNELYVTGSGVVGTSIAIPSITCVPTPPFKVTVVNLCDSSTIHVSPNAGLTPLQFTYVLFDTDYTVINQLPGVPDTVVGFGGLNNTTYYVQVQFNANCGGSAINDTINPGTSDSISPDTGICAGHSVILSAHGLPYGGTYLWQPVNSTDSVITVSPADTTTYYCTYVPPGCNARTDSVRVNILTNATVLVNDTTVCKGDTATLTAVPSYTGGTYLWSPGGDTSASIIVSPASSTTYTVTYAAQCNSPVDTGRVTVQAIPVLTPHNDTVCQGSTAQVSVTPSIPGGTYLWSPGGQATQSIPVSSASTGNYTYNVTYSLALCSVTDSAILVVTSLPILTTVNDTVCQGSMANLSVTSTLTGGTYLWTPGNLNTSTINVIPNSTTTYNVTYTLAACSVVDSALAFVDPMPVLTMTGDSICMGNPGQVSVSPSVTGGSYLWSPGGATVATYIDTPLTTTVYTVTYTAALCSVTGSATITVLPLPTVSVAGDTVCRGTPVQLTAVPSRTGGTYSWAPGGYTAPVITVTPFSTTTYTVTYTIAACGIAVDSAMINVLPMPTLSTTGAAFCDGSSGQLSATPSITGGDYQWAPGGGTDSTITVSPVVTTTYTIHYTLNGCPATDSAIATVYPNPTVNILTKGATCGEPNGSAGAVPTGGTSPYTYVWSNAATTDSITQLAGNHAYSVSVEDMHQCSASATVSVTQATAVVAATTGVNEKCPGYSDGSASATGTGGIPPYAFAWSNNQSTGNVVNLSTGNYVVTISDVTGCSASASVTIAPAPPDVFSSSAQPTSCYGAEYEDGSLSVSPLTNLRQPYQYALNSGAYQVSDTFANLAPGTYSVNVQDDSGCVTTVNNIVVPGAPEGYLSISPADTTINASQTVQLTPTLTPYSNSLINSYSWSPEFGLSCTDCPSPTVSFYGPQSTYTLVITYNGHCTASDTATVIVTNSPQVFIPDVFTPNGDGNNDVFYVYGNDIKSLNLKIFNRWGEEMFESNSQFDGWDGMYKGVLQPSAVYVYEATIYTLNGQTIFRKGSVTLLR